jgi:hypothetical protein
MAQEGGLSQFSRSENGTVPLANAMKNYEATAVLNRLLAVLCRGLPAYLADARPWTRFHRCSSFGFRHSFDI